MGRRVRKEGEEGGGGGEEEGVGMSRGGENRGGLRGVLEGGA